MVAGRCAMGQPDCRRRLAWIHVDHGVGITWSGAGRARLWPWRTHRENAGNVGSRLIAGWPAAPRPARPVCLCGGGGRRSPGRGPATPARACRAGRGGARRGRGLWGRCVARVALVASRAVTLVANGWALPALPALPARPLRPVPEGARSARKGPQARRGPRDHHGPPGAPAEGACGLACGRSPESLVAPCSTTTTPSLKHRARHTALPARLQPPAMRSGSPPRFLPCYLLPFAKRRD